MSPGDRRAVRVLALLIVLGGVARWAMGPGDAPGGVAYQFSPGQRPTMDSVRDRAGRLNRPLARGERIDLGTADALELTRLPGIGPALAAAIVRDRTERGPFPAVSDLQRVPGIGNVLLTRISPHVMVSGQGRVARTPTLSPSRNRIEVNRATQVQLEALPGIGSRRARAIIEYRTAHGPFKSVSELTRVSGIGPAIVAGLEGRVKIP